jgi:hypothetical protein
MAWDSGFDQAESSSSSSSSSTSSSSSSVSSSSRSSSSSSALGGTVVWGHHTAVSEDHDEDFDGNWTEVSGWSSVGTPGTDNETFNTTGGSQCAQVSESQDWNLGPMTAVIRVDKYQTGSGPAPIIHYKTAVSSEGLVGASWTLYNGVSFTSLGWIKLRITHT